MREAKSAIAGIQKADMAELKVINNPTAAIKTVMGAICLLLDAKTQDWKCAKKLL